MKTRKEHEAEIRWAVNACADAAKALWDAEQRSRQAQYRLEQALELLLTEYQNASEVKQ